MYCDQVFELPALKPWLAIDDPHVSTQYTESLVCRNQPAAGSVLDSRHRIQCFPPWVQVRAKEPFTPAMLREVEQYYFGHYCRHFGTPEFAAALAAIPFVFNWDDHDIFDVSKWFSRLSRVLGTGNRYTLLLLLGHGSGR